MSNQAKKTIGFKMPEKPQAAVKAGGDQWVKDRVQPDEQAAPISAASAQPEAPKLVPVPAAPPAAAPKPEEMKRFTIDVTETLHKRIKAECAMRGVHMADVIRDMLEKEFAKS
jgi:3-oxoacyl-ACP reductase-like protein